MGRSSGVLAVAVAVAALMLARPVAADSQATSLVLEVYVGERPKDANKFVAPMFDELRTRSYLAGAAAVGEVLSSALRSRSAAGDPDAVERLMSRIETGYQAWLDGKFSRAAEVLASVVELADRVPLAIAERDGLRSRYRDALVGLALAQRRLGDDDAARRTMADVVRTFRDAPIQRFDYGQDAHRLYVDVHDELAATTGELAVQVDDAEVAIFVQEQYAGIGHAHLRDLPAGRYRVLIRKGNVARVHDVVVEPKLTAALDVSWRLDAAVRSGVPWSGLSFASGASRDADVGELAAHIARVTGAPEVVTVEIEDGGGGRAVVGRVYAHGARPIRQRSIPIDANGPRETELRELATFLATQTAPKPVHRDRAVQRGSGRRLLPWFVIGLGAAATIAGGVLLSMDEDSPPLNPDGPEPKTYFDSARGGVGLLTGGALVVGGGMLLLLLGGDEDNRTERAGLVIRAVADGGYLGWQGRF